MKGKVRDQEGRNEQRCYILKFLIRKFGLEIVEREFFMHFSSESRCKYNLLPMNNFCSLSLNHSTLCRCKTNRSKDFNRVLYHWGILIYLVLLDDVGDTDFFFDSTDHNDKRQEVEVSYNISQKKGTSLSFTLFTMGMIIVFFFVVLKYKNCNYNCVLFVQTTVRVRVPFLPLILW